MIQKKKGAIKLLAIHEKDVGSTEVQIGLLTEKISKLSEHFKNFKKDKHSTLGLTKSVNKRKKLLNYLKKRNPDSYQKVITVNNGSGHYAPGETVKQNTGQVDALGVAIYVTAEVVAFSQLQGVGTLTLINEIGSDGTARKLVVSTDATKTLVGQDSGAAWYVQVDAPELAMTGDPYAQNQDFETTGDNIIDFTESNPFGEIT